MPSRDPVRLISLGIRQRRGKIEGGLVYRAGGQDDARTERGQPRVGIAQAKFTVARLAVPHRHHAERRRQVLDRDLGAQFVEVELFHQGRSQSSRAIEKETAAIPRRGFDHDEIGNDFALRGEQRGIARRAGRQALDIGSEQAIEEAPAVVAGDLDDAAFGKERCLHGHSQSLKALGKVSKSLARTRGET